MGQPNSLRELLQAELPALYAMAFHVCGDRRDAYTYLQDLVRDANAMGESVVLDFDPPRDALVAKLARNLEEGLGRRAGFSFDALDNVLRSDVSQPIDLDIIGPAGPGQDPQGQVHVLLWELKRTCLTATMGCLPPGVRLSLVLTDLLGYTVERASELLGIKESAYRVRLTRARKRIEDYLAPRCTHVDRQNPCTCPGRLAIAMNANFVSEPHHRLDIPVEPYDAGGPKRDIVSLYRSLPDVRLTDAELERLLSSALPPSPPA